MQDIIFDHLNFQKTIQLLNHFTKMNIRFFDHTNYEAIEFVVQQIPTLLCSELSDYKNLSEIFEKIQTGSCLYAKDSFGLEFITAEIRRNDLRQGFVQIGPFLSSIPNSEWISTIIINNNLPINERKQLQEFYQSLTVINANDSNWIADLLTNLTIQPHVFTRLESSVVMQPILNHEQAKSIAVEKICVIEKRFAFEKKVMNAISHGDIMQLNNLYAEFGGHLLLPDNVPSRPIRSAKNELISVDTLCRMAAEKGGLPPEYVYYISEKFNVLIERTEYLPDLKALCSHMLVEYCEIVNEYSTKYLNDTVKNAVNYINRNLLMELTLQEIAKNVHANSSYLSRKFRQEVGLNITDFINRQRVEASKTYLQKDQLSITEVAFMVGFNDLNYFTRVFKKYTSKTPTQYIKESRVKQHEL
ncbi:helix-turn-helix domain-containing protein [Paenibacillus sp. P36]|uniref:helix-turn-helix domain-containing protein n=1 Tax=Paenibacillus sp. P36 TaxID=3342538 RepID=UPI0038B359F5